MQEKHIEQTLVKATRQAGGTAYKFTSPGTAGVPDRLIILPHGKHAFIEVKAPGKQPRPIQVHQHQKLTNLGHKVYILDNPNDIPRILHEIQTT